MVYNTYGTKQDIDMHLSVKVPIVLEDDGEGQKYTYSVHHDTYLVWIWRNWINSIKYLWVDKLGYQQTRVHVAYTELLKMPFKRSMMSDFLMIWSDQRYEQVTSNVQSTTVRWISSFWRFQHKFPGLFSPKVPNHWNHWFNAFKQTQWGPLH